MVHNGTVSPAEARCRAHRWHQGPERPRVLYHSHTGTPSLGALAVASRGGCWDEPLSRDQRQQPGKGCWGWGYEWEWYRAVTFSTLAAPYSHLGLLKHMEACLPPHRRLINVIWGWGSTDLSPFPWGDFEVQVGWGVIGSRGSELGLLMNWASLFQIPTGCVEPVP